MANLPKEKKQKQKPVNEFFIFNKPMVAEGREETLLGVAFENPRDGTLGRYTPQGPQEEETRPQEEETPSFVASSLSALGNRFASFASASSPQDDAAQATAGAAQPAPPHPGQDKLLYRSPCKWPKDLVKGIYPNKPTIAVGVEACLENAKDASMHAKILNAIATGLKVRSSELDTTVVPIVRRYSTEDPWAKIFELLHDKDYREHVTQLFSLQTPGKRNILWVATNLIACSGLAYDRIEEDEQSLSADVKDPTKTVPAKIGGKLRHIKHSTLEGKYESDIVMMMSYRRIRYECVKQDTAGGWWWSSSKGQRQKSVDAKAIGFARDDGAKDLYWIDVHETEKGDVPAWIGEDDPPTGSFISEGRAIQEEPSAMFENASFADTIAGAEEDVDGEELPDGFFDQSSSEEE